MAAFGLKKLNIIPSFFIFAYLPRCCCAVLQSLVPRWRFSTLVGSRVIPQFTRLPQFGQSAKPSASRTGGSVSMVVSIFAVMRETYWRFFDYVHVVGQRSSRLLVLNLMMQGLLPGLVGMAISSSAPINSLSSWYAYRRENIGLSFLPFILLNTR